MFTSVVIPAYQKVDLLAECLDRLESQTSRSFEVLVVSDGCGDVVSFVSGYRSSYPLSVYNTGYEGFGVALAKNMGIHHAIGEQIIILGPDCLVESDFVALHQSFYEPGLLVLGTLPSVELDEIGCIDYVCMDEQRDIFYSYANLEDLEFGLDFSHLTFSGNMSFSRADALSIGGFDVGNFLGEGGSDTDFGRRHALKFGRIKFIRNPAFHVGLMSNVEGSKYRTTQDWSRDILSELVNRPDAVVDFIWSV